MKIYRSLFSIALIFSILLSVSASLFQVQATGKRIIAAQTDGRYRYALNTPNTYNYGPLFVWQYIRSDRDQIWDYDFVSPTGTYMIRRHYPNNYGTYFCINTPNRNNGGDVFMWQCNYNDRDQRWQIINRGGGKVYRLEGTGYCLSAPTKSNYGNVVIEYCNKNDGDTDYYDNPNVKFYVEEF